MIDAISLSTKGPWPQPEQNDEIRVMFFLEKKVTFAAWRVHLPIHHTNICFLSEINFPWYHTYSSPGQVISFWLWTWHSIHHFSCSHLQHDFILSNVTSFDAMLRHLLNHLSHTNTYNVRDKRWLTLIIERYIHSHTESLWFRPQSFVGSFCAWLHPTVPLLSLQL